MSGLSAHSSVATDGSVQLGSFGPRVVIKTGGGFPIVMVRWLLRSKVCDKTGGRTGLFVKFLK